LAVWLLDVQMAAAAAAIMREAAEATTAFGDNKMSSD